MKRRFLLAFLIIFLAGCVGSAASDGDQCSHGICIGIKVSEPILWGEPILVNIILTTDKDISNLGVLMGYESGTLVEDLQNWEAEAKNIKIGERAASWIVDTKAGQSLVFTRKLRVPPTEGKFELRAEVYRSDLIYLVDTVDILLTRKGGVVNPPIKRDSERGVDGIEREINSPIPKCRPGPCLTIKIDEPVLWDEPVKGSLEILGDKDFPELGITIKSSNPSVGITAQEGDFKDKMTWQAGVWWLTDVIAYQAQEYTFLASLPTQEGLYNLHAEGYDLDLGQVSSFHAGIQLSREGGKVYYTSLGMWPPNKTPVPTTTQYFTPTPEFSPMPTPAVYPPPEEPPIILAPSPEVYPPPEDSSIPFPTPGAVVAP